MFRFFLACCFVLLVPGAFAAPLQDFFATSVPNTSNWNDEQLAENEPPNRNCDMGTPDYAFNDAGTTWLIATNFQNITIPAGQALDTVEASALARYDRNEAGTIEVDARWNGGARSRQFNINSSSGDCRWRTVPLTDGEADFWSQAELNSLTLRVRRVSTNNNNDLRVKGFRIRVTFAADCDGNGLPDYRDFQMGAPDCNGNGQLDVCDQAAVNPGSDNFSATFGGTTTFNLVQNDAGWDQGWLQVVLLSAPTKGTLQGPFADGRVTYVSAGGANNCGFDGFSYRLAGIGACSGYQSAAVNVGIFMAGASSDCNGNCLDDAQEVNAGISPDCNGNGVPDSCDQNGVSPSGDDFDVPFGGAVDINLVNDDTGWDPSWMEVYITSGPSRGTITPTATPGIWTYTSSGTLGDCGGDRFDYQLRGIGSCSAWQSDSVEVDGFIFPGGADCNGNCQDDQLDIAQGIETDCNQNGVPDDCEGVAELRTVGDFFNVEYGGTFILDLAANDPDFDATRTEVVIITGPQYGSVVNAPMPGQVVFQSSNFPTDCGSDSLRYRLIGIGECTDAQSDLTIVNLNVAAQPDDCNGNCQSDAVDLANGLATDCDGDGILTECESEMEDCNGNGMDDCTELAQGLVSDVNQNGVPDECEALTSVYCQSMLNSAGCVPAVEFLGTPSISSSDFLVFVPDLLHPTIGLLLWSFLPEDAPLFGGTLCVGQPFRRTMPRTTNPTPEQGPCNGLLIFRWSSELIMDEGFLVGSEVFCQFYSRDTGASAGAHLTDAVRFTVLP